MKQFTVLLGMIVALHYAAVAAKALESTLLWWIIGGGSVLSALVFMFLLVLQFDVEDEDSRPPAGDGDDVAGL